MASGTRVTTQAANGRTGKWLIDPNDFTIAASGGDTDAATVAGNLATTNFEIQTATMGTGGGNGDIFVNQAVSWSSAHTLTLTAERNVAINSAITANSGGLAINAAGNISAPAAVNVGTFILQSGTWSQISGSLPTFSATDFRISGGTFMRALGGDGAAAATAYQLSDIYGLQGLGGAALLGRSYQLANNIDASGTSAWNANAGFNPIGTQATPFTGKFDGQSHTISNLTINRPGIDRVGLFGSTDSASIANVGLVGASVTGDYFIGTLVGLDDGSSTISNSYASGGTVKGRGDTGGLIGTSSYNDNITNSYASVAVTVRDGVVGGHGVGNEGCGGVEGG